MSSRIPQTTLEEILRRSDMAAVLGRYTTLRRSGRKFMALCPFHNEKTPSMSVDVEKGLFYCFGCQESGSLFDFVMKMEGLSFREAALRLAADAGVVVEITEEASQEDSERQRALNLLDRVAGYYHELLLRSPLGQAGRDYLASRGISRETAEKFRLGWAPEGGGSLLRKLSESGFSVAEGIACGVLTDRSGGARDLLRARLVFPIADVQGRVLAFGGRAMGDAQPKYLNSPETSWYSKRMHLYGLNHARGAISRADEAIVTEGYFDVVSLHQGGVPRAVASLGTALTEEQATLLRRYASKAVLAYDADRAGQAAAWKGGEILEDAGLRVSVARMPAGEDPDSLVRRGAVEEVLADSVGLVEFQMDRMAAGVDLSTPEGKEDFVREVLPAISRIRDSARQDAYVRRLAYRTGISEQKLHWRLGRAGSRGPAARTRRAPLALEPELALLRVLANEPQWATAVNEVLTLDVVSPPLRGVYAALLAMNGRSEPVTFHELLPHVAEEGMASKLTEILAQEPLQSTHEDVRKLAISIRDRSLQERLDVLRKEVVPAIEAGRLTSEDPLYQEYYRLRSYFDRRGKQ